MEKMSSSDDESGFKSEAFERGNGWCKCGYCTSEMKSV